LALDPGRKNNIRARELSKKGRGSLSADSALQIPGAFTIDLQEQRGEIARQWRTETVKMMQAFLNHAKCTGSMMPPGANAWGAPA
jgi:hypothetical protein